jgi:hypothetical protein
VNVGGIIVGQATTGLNRIHVSWGYEEMSQLAFFLLIIAVVLVGIVVLVSVNDPGGETELGRAINDVECVVDEADGLIEGLTTE